MKKRKYEPPRGKPPEKPLFKRPELILHPMLPKDVHEINPRTIKGEEWWNAERLAAYSKNNFCCWACGKHITEMADWLHGHEAYKYDYGQHTIELEEVVALCVMCHDAIHLGRVQLVKPDLVNTIYAWVRENFSTEIFRDWLNKDLQLEHEHLTSIEPWWLIIDGKKYNRYNKEGVENV